MLVDCKETDGAEPVEVSETVHAPETRFTSAICVDDADNGAEVPLYILKAVSLSALSRNDICTVAMIKVQVSTYVADNSDGATGAPPFCPILHTCLVARFAVD